MTQRPIHLAARNAPLVLLIVITLFFARVVPGYFTAGNFLDILVSVSAVAIAATGMTIVLLTGGIDLSIGATMFIAAAISGKLVYGELLGGLAPVPIWSAILLIVPVGVALGAVNALCIARFRMMPFVVTLATLFIGRGIALQITETRELSLPDAYRAIGHLRVMAIPLPVMILVAVVAAGHILLVHTPFGRQIYAMGNNPEAARKAGINTRRLLASVYVISGLTAAVAGIVSVAQLGAVSPKFGLDMEFAAIGAAVLGGTSLFGGRGSILPGTIVGALIVQSAQSGLQMLGVKPDAQPVITAAIIFFAVLVDRLTHRGRTASAQPGDRTRSPVVPVRAKE